MVKELNTALVVVAVFGVFSLAIVSGITSSTTGGATYAMPGAAPAAAPACEHMDMDGDGYAKVMCGGEEARGSHTDCMDCVGQHCVKINPNGGTCLSGKTMMTCSDGEVHVRSCPGGCVPSGTDASDFCKPAPPRQPGPGQPTNPGTGQHLEADTLNYGTLA